MERWKEIPELGKPLMADVRTVDMYKIQKWRIELEKSGVTEDEERLTGF